MDRKGNAKFISFNCKSLKRSFDGIRDLCNKADIIALQETWLFPHELPELEGINKEFGSTGTSAMDASAGLLTGRPYGGVAILWRKSAFRSVSVIDCGDARLSAVKIQASGMSFMLFSVYMPTDCPDNLHTFTQCLSSISAIIEENSDCSVVYMLGDFNAHPNELFCRHLLEFCDDQTWTCVDLNLMKDDTYTFISEAHGCVRWLDHCVVTNAALSTIVNVQVEYDVQWSDHFPLIIDCDLDLVPYRHTMVSTGVFSGVVWGEHTDEQVRRYSKICHEQLREIDIPGEMSYCCDGTCVNAEHKLLIRNMYLRLVTILSAAATASCKVVRVRRRGGYVAGWNKYVAYYHREARLRFLTWVEAGKPNTGQTYVDMKKSSKSFKQKLKLCQDRQVQFKMDALASLHSANNFKQFWKVTGNMSQKPGLPVCVDGISDKHMIANMFSEHFRVLPQHKTDMSRSCGAGSIGSQVRVRFTAKEVSRVISGMSGGKSPGCDGLSIEHLRHAGVCLPHVLSQFYNLCLCHGYLPEELTKTIVVPIIKNRTGDVSDRNNYRPISLANIMAKVLDGLLNDILMKHIKLHEAQFGFRSGLSTESAILCLKQAVQYYTDRKTPIYACFLDLSKAFDTVLYDKLWGKLGDAGVPVEVVSLFQE
ncbi:uncharacterized protein LOC123666124 [Melitaea cinxia]|uniref:uncharacterized protein LOC123666124 n=1 Tax=Melitaea cinxia TaxID=113334 RepID=UPI001E27059E|nr:uncharacterized protein LOC123666124 [Melitaea cinxia]